MVLSGIDFSINSASVCISDGQEYNWFHFGREKTKYFYLGNQNFNQYLLNKRVKAEDYCNNERMKLKDSQKLCDNIVSVLFENGVTHVAFEAHSFNSIGNSLLELVSYQFLLRSLINTKLGISDTDMYFYSPITIKAFAGGAKFKKRDLLEKFVQLEDERLISNDVFIKIKNDWQTLIKKDDVVKPVDDVIDSYWILKKLEQDV